MWDRWCIKQRKPSSNTCGQVTFMILVHASPVFCNISAHCSQDGLALVQNVVSISEHSFICAMIQTFTFLARSPATHESLISEWNYHPIEIEILLRHHKCVLTCIKIGLQPWLWLSSIKSRRQLLMRYFVWVNHRQNNGHINWLWFSSCSSGNVCDARQHRNKSVSLVWDCSAAPESPKKNCLPCDEPQEESIHSSESLSESRFLTW